MYKYLYKLYKYLDTLDFNKLFYCICILESKYKKEIKYRVLYIQFCLEYDPETVSKIQSNINFIKLQKYDNTELLQKRNTELQKLITIQKFIDSLKYTEYYLFFTDRLQKIYTLCFDNSEVYKFLSLYYLCKFDVSNFCKYINYNNYNIIEYIFTILETFQYKKILNSEFQKELFKSIYKFRCSF